MTVPSIVHLKTSNCQMMFHFVFFCFIYFPLKYLHLGVSTNGGIVGYCWFRVENPSFEMNDNWGYPYISENLHISYIYIYIYIYSYIITWVLNPQWSKKWDLRPGRLVAEVPSVAARAPARSGAGACDSSPPWTEATGAMGRVNRAPAWINGDQNITIQVYIYMYIYNMQFKSNSVCVHIYIHMYPYTVKKIYVYASASTLNMMDIPVPKQKPSTEEEQTVEDDH